MCYNPGPGKTATAVHWAHRVREEFPDGQLYVNLRGFDPSGTPTEPGEAIRIFLDALGVPPQQVPADLDARSGLYRSLVADRRMLVLLDNARDADQVRPLLPGAPGCVVLVTSRNRLTGLIAAEGALPVLLDVLSPDEARQLLTRRLGADRVAAEPDAVECIVAACARLPLALSIAAARAATRPQLPLAALADELADAHGPLFVLDGGDPATDVRAVFASSYRALQPAAARMFRLLGLHPGPDISTPAAASLAGVSLDAGLAALSQLAQAHLLTEPAAGRYAFHDLLRSYAAELAAGSEPEADRQAAAHRMFDHYLHTAHAAALLLRSQPVQITLDPPRPGATPELIVDRPHARAWFTAEIAVILSALRWAVAGDLDGHAWRLAWTLVDFLDRQGRWRDQLFAQRIALDATRRLGDKSGQAAIHRLLGRAETRAGNHDAAHHHYQCALDLFTQLDDRLSEAHTHTQLSVLRQRQGRFDKAVSHGRQALHLFRGAGDRLGEARALDTIGWGYVEVEPRQALVHCGQALALYEELGDIPGQAGTWDSLGCAHQRLGDYQQAAVCFQQALDLIRRAGDRYYEAVALTHIGDNHRAAGDAEAARAAWREALVILDELGHPTADQLRAKLASR